MEPLLVIRNTGLQDIDFIIETIIEAEKSFTNKINYFNVFSLTEKELISIFKEILRENVTGQELCYSDYLIAEVKGEIAGACGAWVEGANGFSSAVIKGNILLEFIPHDKIRKAKHYFTTLQELNIEREKDTLQIANAYLKEKFRGKGLVGKLINENIRIHKALCPQLIKVQLRPTITNDSAIRAYNKLGFEITSKKSTNDENVLD